MNNEGKIREMKKILIPLGYEVLSQREANIELEVEETGTTYEENAVLKAEAIYNILYNYDILGNHKNVKKLVNEMMKLADI